MTPRSSSAPPAPVHLVARARAVSGTLHDLFRARHRNLARIAHTLALFQREELHRALGFKTIAEYAWAEHEMGRSKVSELIGISEASEVLPRTRAAFDAGELVWTKAREVAKVATPETEGEWLARARVLTAEDLRAARKGEPPGVRRTLTLTPEAAAVFDQLVAGLRDAELNGGSDAEVVLELMRRGASGQGGAAPTRRLVIHECRSCQATTSESREGPVPVGPAAVAQTRCAGEVHDLTQPENPVKRAVPAAVQRRVRDRDRGRCLVPGCRALASLETHHEDGWRRGHDPARLVTVCSAHHRMRHEGLLRIEGEAPAFRFSLADGAPILDAPAPARAVAYENPPRPSTSGASPGVIRDVTQGLRNLGLAAREARRLVRVALASDVEREWDAGSLARTALQAS